MKNRMISKAAGLGISAFLLTTAVLGNWGQLPVVLAADVDNSGIRLEQKAVWTDENSGRGEIIMEVSGLLTYKNNQPEMSAEVLDEDEVLRENGQQEYAQQESMQQMNAQQEYAQQEDIQQGNTQWENAQQEYAQQEDIQRENTQQENAQQENIQQENAQQEYVLQEYAAEEQSEDVGAEYIPGGPDIPGEFIIDGGSIESSMLETTVDSRGEPGSENIGNEGMGIAESEIGADFADRLNAAVPGSLYVVNYISEYFQADSEALPEGCTVETLPVHNQKGGQTVLTKITYPINLQNLTQDTLSLRIPIILYEEYRTPGEDVKYPVSQDEPLEKDRPGTGAFVELRAETGEGNSSRTLAGAVSPVLQVAAAQADFTLDLKDQAAAVKAGEAVNYELEVSNTGNVGLSGIRLTPSFLQNNLTAAWEPADGLEIEGSQAILTSLGKGENRSLKLSVQLPEEMEGNLDFTVKGETFKPGTTDKIISREAALHIPVTSLKVDFTVEKTADRTIAVPGDTITYQICIRNTGERTLHSVVGTERFLSAGVYAQFVEKAGVVLNSSKNQALISQIKPGEAFALEAVVTLPQNFASQELINQVTVVAKETGSRSVQSQAGVTIQAPGPTPSPYPSPGLYQSGSGAKSGGSLAGKASSYPKTADPSRPGLLAALMLGSLLAAAMVLRHRKQKTNH